MRNGFFLDLWYLFSSSCQATVFVPSSTCFKQCEYGFSYVGNVFCSVLFLPRLELFGGFVFFFGRGRFTLCIWERGSMKSLNSFKTRTMRSYQIYLEGFSSNFFLSVFLFVLFVYVSKRSYVKGEKI
jgi:hypothetical protein